jgi:hypothetical protein
LQQRRKTIRNGVRWTNRAIFPARRHQEYSKKPGFKLAVYRDFPPFFRKRGATVEQNESGRLRPACKEGRPSSSPHNGFAVIAGEAAPEFIIGPRFARTRWPRL